VKTISEPLADGRVPQRLVEIGVGTGYFALLWLETLPEAELWAADVEPRMLGVVMGRAMERGLARRVHFIEVAAAEAERIPALEGTFDAMLMANLLHEIDQRESYLTDLHGKLTPGGRLVVCDWDPRASTDHGPPVDHRVPIEEARALLEGAGFTRVEERPLYGDFYTLVAS